VHLELVLFGDPDPSQEQADIIPLIALQLNHLAVLDVLDDRAVAGELLLERFDEFLEVELFSDALHCGQCLAAIALLDADVDEALGVAALRRVSVVSCAAA